MIDVRQAVENATDYASNLYGDELFDVRLEEVELSKDRRTWLITLGLRRKKRHWSPTVEAVRQHTGAPPEPDEREYKRFHVDAKTGDVKSMKIRTVA